MKNVEKYVGKKVGKTLYKYNMIEDNDKILLCVSGGKDSFVLLYDFIKRIGSFPRKFEFEVIHAISDLSEIDHKGELEALFKDLEIKYNFIDVPVMKRMEIKGKKHLNCYWCATQRRIEIFKFARDNSFTKIALAHSMDDAVETLLLNIFYKSEIAGMLPVMKYTKFPITIIRPLYNLEEKTIMEYAKKKHFKDLGQYCSLKGTTRRETVKGIIKDISKHNKAVRKNILNAMKNVKYEFLPDE